MNRRMLWRIESLGIVWNMFLFGLQLLVLFISVVSPPMWSSFFPILLFIGLEIIRNGWAKSVAELTRSISKHGAQMEQINETFRVVRNERHDFLKHISAIHFMLENNRPNDAKNYFDKLVESYEETNLSIKGESGVVAGVLHQAYLRAKKSGIVVIYDLDLPLSTLPLFDQKNVSLIGNLLSNSLDACEEWQVHRGKQATVTVEFYKRSGLFILQCKNNSLPIPGPILDELFDSHGKTTKGGTHEGLGTKIIKDIVEEHHGFLDFVYKDEEFEVKIKVPAIR
ncbi:MAG TPA: GHKL domain-containing protein [Pseudoneobacillus sp.]|nr:GHKL domain-containing protein [Pseudoneobacillus sp.]